MSDITPVIACRCRMLFAMLRFLALIGTSLTLTTALGQSLPAAASIPTFHVEGTIDSMTNGVAPHVEVSFVSEHTNRTVVVDDRGFYQIDLPVGIYTMTAFFPRHPSPLTRYVRFFQVTSPTKIHLNGILFGSYTCDEDWKADITEVPQELVKDVCGGEDSFPVPSNSGTPLHVDINYTRRQRIGEWLVYGTRAAIPRPVLVSYNLFALQAESVSYDEKNRTVQAHGNVVFEDQFGRKQAESAAFKIENGNAIRTQ